jgi:hypothetical protein
MDMNLEPIFSADFLEPYLAEFRLRSVSGIDAKMKVLRRWQEEVRSGKVKKLKEEEVKSRFISEIFGLVLGFNIHNPLNWQVREEHKVVVGATKPDASLGYFSLGDGQIGNQVRVVVEIKGAGSDLDKKQSRAAMLMSPVEQAFQYAAKSGGHCKWVVVSNLLSIRFYHYSGQHTYQKFSLEELAGEEKLKEFLLLFHKDNFTNSANSPTDKLFVLSRANKVLTKRTGHILDEMYHSVIKFDGLGFVDPSYVCNLRPFNIQDKYVWHFETGRMLTLNAEIGKFLSGVEYLDGKVSFNGVVQYGLKKAKVLDAAVKMGYLIDFFNNCLISELCVPLDVQAVFERAKKSMGFSIRHFHHYNNAELFIFSTKSKSEETCGCINCLYRSLDFRKLIELSENTIDHQSMEPLERGYLDYILASDNFRRSYFTYKHAERESKGEESGHSRYFLSKINQMHLYNLVESYSDENSEKQEILQDIKSIDLDHSIHNELDLYVSPELRRYLIEIKENNLLQRVSKKVDEILQKCIDGNASGYDLRALGEQYNYLYSHFHKNYLVFDAFTTYKDVVAKFTRAVFIFYSRPKGGLNSIGSFHLLEAVIYVPPAELKKYLDLVGDIKMKAGEKEKLIAKASAFLRSFYKNAAFGPQKERTTAKQLLNWHFTDKVTNIFANLFHILAKVDFNEQQIAVFSEGISMFMAVEDFLGWFDLVPFASFLERYGFILKKHELENMLKKCISEDSYGTHKYYELIAGICMAYQRFYPQDSIADHSLVHMGVANCMDSQGHCRMMHLIPLFSVLTEQLRKALLAYYENSLEVDFDDETFYALIDAGIITTEYKDYFLRWMKTTQRTKFSGFIGFNDEGEDDFTDTVLINVIFRFYLYGINTEREELKVLSKLSDFEKWAIWPEKFDYHLFDPRWLLVIDRPYILAKIAHIEPIAGALNALLKVSFNHRLAHLYFEYFNVEKF